MTSVVNGNAMNGLMNGGISNAINAGMNSVMNSALYSGASTPPGSVNNSSLSSMAVGMNNLANAGQSSGLGNAGINQFGGIGMNRNMAVMQPMQKARRPEEEEESFFSISGLHRSNSRLEGRSSPSLAAFDQNAGSQQRFPPSSTSASQFQPVGNAEQRQRTAGSLFQPFSANNGGGMFMGSVDDLALQQRGSQLPSATLPLNLQQQPNPLGQQPQQQFPPLGSPNRSMTNAQRSLLAQFMNNLNNSMNQQSKKPLTSATSNSLFPGTSNNLFQFNLDRNSQGAESMLASLDLDFPTLSNRPAMQTSLPQSRNYVGMVNRPQPDSQEFQIHNEDFPALPGTQQITATNYSLSKVLSQSVSNSDALNKASGDKNNSSQSRRGIQTHPDGTISNIPLTMVADQYGIVGLLAFIRAIETEPNLVTLAHGIDLTTLGLNLTSQENIYSTFQSPWAETACRPQDIDYHVPSEYVTNLFIRDKLAQIKLSQYNEDLLFFLFYMNGGDILQLTAAAELYRRDWRYHKEERIWITHTDIEPSLKTNKYERGTYYVFDVQSWRKLTKDLHLEYDMLEEKPQLPMSAVSAPASQQQLPPFASSSNFPSVAPF